MNNPREIAERIIEIKERGKFEHTNSADRLFKEEYSSLLAKAYLELETKLSLEQQDRESEKRNYKIRIEAYECYIEKLKKSREVLRKAVEFYGDINSWDRNDLPKGFCAIFNSLKNDHDGDPNLETDNGRENLSNYAGKKAREAIKQDDEIMGEK